MNRCDIPIERWRRWREDRSNALSPLARSIAAFLEDEIQRQRLRHGEPMPSVRAVGSICGCSHDTSARAYEELCARGRVESRRGSGYFVVRSAGLSPPSDRIAAEALPIEDARWLISTHIPIQHRPGSALIHPELASVQEIACAARSALRVRQDIFGDYNAPAGYLPLRGELQRSLAGSGIDCSVEEIMTGAGATGVLSILIRALVRQGNCVLMDDPGPFLHRNLSLSQGAHILPIPRDADGPSIAHLRTACENHDARIFLMSSRAQNPTGRSITVARAHEIKRISDEFGLMLVDDDSYAETMPSEGRPSLPLRALGRSDRIVHVSSLTRIVAPGMSVGYLVASGATLQQLLLYKAAQLGAGSVIPERIFYHFIAEGRYRRFIRRLRLRISESRRTTLALLLQEGIAPDEQADGLFAWVKVADMIGPEQFRAMLDMGYLIAPTFHFSKLPEFAGYTRLNVTTTSLAFVELLRSSMPIRQPLR